MRRMLQAAAERREREEREAALRRKQAAVKSREYSRELQAKLGIGSNLEGAPTTQAEAGAGCVEEARAAAAAAARANPPPPKPIPREAAPVYGAGRPSDVKQVSSVSLSGCGYWFEDVGDAVRLCVPLEKYLGEAALPKECATARFSELRATLEVALDERLYVLDTGELAHSVKAEACTCKLRHKTRRVVLEMPKVDKQTAWKKLTAI